LQSLPFGVVTFSSFFFLRQTPSLRQSLFSFGLIGLPLGPLHTSKEGPENNASTTATFFADVGYLLMVLLAVFLPVALIDLLIVFAFVMLLGFFIQLSIVDQAATRGDSYW
jgi:hypothetical protein